METTVAKIESTNGQLQSFDLMGKLPNLADAKVIHADLTSEYCTPPIVTGKQIGRAHV